MSKPPPSQLTFATVSPPWSLTNLDTNFSNLFAAINDIGTYSNVLVDAGTVNAIVCAPAVGITVSLFAGLTLDVTVLNTTTSNTPTLNVGGLGGKLITDNFGNGLPIGALVAGATYRFIYDGTNFRLQVMMGDSGTFTGTLTGCTTSPTATFNWVRNWNFACVYLTGTNLLATSNTSACTVTGVPAVITPVNGLLVPCFGLENNTVGGVAGAAQVTNGGSMTLYLLVQATVTFVANAFATSGTKGINSGFCVTYPLV